MTRGSTAQSCSSGGLAHHGLAREPHAPSRRVRPAPVCGEPCVPVAPSSRRGAQGRGLLRGATQPDLPRAVRAAPGAAPAPEWVPDPQNGPSWGPTGSAIPRRVPREPSRMGVGRPHPGAPCEPKASVQFTGRWVCVTAPLCRRTVGLRHASLRRRTVGLHHASLRRLVCVTARAMVCVTVQADCGSALCVTVQTVVCVTAQADGGSASCVTAQAVVCVTAQVDSGSASCVTAQVDGGSASCVMRRRWSASLRSSRWAGGCGGQSNIRVSACSRPGPPAAQAQRALLPSLCREPWPPPTSLSTEPLRPRGWSPCCRPTWPSAGA